MKVVEESRLCGGTDFGVHILFLFLIISYAFVSKNIYNKIIY